MTKLLRYVSSVGLAALTLTLLAPGARAGLIAEYSLNGGATFTTICTDVSGGACGKTFTTSNGLAFTLFGADSNSPGTATSAETLQATVQVKNGGASTASIEILVGDNGFTAPVAPPPVSLINNISGTVLTGGAANLFSSEACVGPNATIGCPGTAHTPVINSNITVAGAGSNSNNVLLASLSAPYSLAEMINFTLVSGSNINYSASADVQPVAEPASLALLGVGIVGIGFVTRRKCNRSNLMSA